MRKLLNESQKILSQNHHTNKVQQLTIVLTKRTQPPMGLSIAPVSSRGRYPKCKYCHGTIQQMEWHTINRTHHRDNNKRWYLVSHYHFLCFAGLSRPEQNQLKTIVDTSNDVGDATKKDLHRAMDKEREESME